MREPLIEAIDGSVVSRNAYGCLVLNSPQAMFVDIDFPAYRKPGLRLLATHQTFDPESPQVAEVFEQLGADPLYGKLCRIQKYFRARLSLKPWRCGLNAPEVRWPWGSDDQAGAFSDWQIKYQVKSAGYATCWLLGVVGGADVHASLVRLLAHHDAATGVGIDRPLA